MEIVMVEQDVLQQELAKCSGIANPTVSDIVYGYNQCEWTKERAAETLGVERWYSVKEIGKLEWLDGLFLESIIFISQKLYAGFFRWYVS